MTFAIKLIGLADGERTPFDGQFVQEYDPERDGPVVNGRQLQCWLVTTPDPAGALRFPVAADAFAFYRRQSKRLPVRPWDGRPNRPLTAFTVSILPVETVAGGA